MVKDEGMIGFTRAPLKLRRYSDQWQFCEKIVRIWKLRLCFISKVYKAYC